jgi:hypothetical protein
MDATMLGGDDGFDLLYRFVEMPLAIYHAVIVPFLLGQFIRGVGQTPGALGFCLAPAGMQTVL